MKPASPLPFSGKSTYAQATSDSKRPIATEKILPYNMVSDVAQLGYPTLHFAK